MVCLTLSGVGVEKVRQQNVLFSYECRCQVFLHSVRLSGGWQNRCYRLAEEPH